MDDFIGAGLRQAIETLDWFYKDEAARSALGAMVDGCAQALGGGGRVLTCGNGGSFCDATHLAEELSGRFRKDRPALAGLALSDGAFITCAANDFGFQEVFARGVEALGKPGDVLVAFSTSGNSPNIVRAVEAAQRREMLCYGMLGRSGGRLAELCHRSLIVPAETSDRIQEIHVKALHLLVEGIERHLFPSLY